MFLARSNVKTLSLARHGNETTSVVERSAASKVQTGGTPRREGMFSRTGGRACGREGLYGRVVTGAPSPVPASTLRNSGWGSRSGTRWASRRHSWSDDRDPRLRSRRPALDTRTPRGRQREHTGRARRPTRSVPALLSARARWACAPPRARWTRVPRSFCLLLQIIQNVMVKLNHFNSVA